MILVISLSLIETKPLTNIEQRTNTDVKEKITTEAETFTKKSEPLCDGDCVIDYEEEDEARNEFDQVWDELDGQNPGFPIRVVFYIGFLSVCSLAIFGLIIFFCIKICW